MDDDDGELTVRDSVFDNFDQFMKGQNMGQSQLSKKMSLYQILGLKKSDQNLLTKLLLKLNHKLDENTPDIEYS